MFLYPSVTTRVRGRGGASVAQGPWGRIRFRDRGGGGKQAERSKQSRRLGSMQVRAGYIEPMPITIIMRTDGINNLVFDSGKKTLCTKDSSDNAIIRGAEVQEIMTEKSIAAGLYSPVSEGRSITKSKKTLAESEGVRRKEGGTSNTKRMPVAINAKGSGVRDAIA